MSNESERSFPQHCILSSTTLHSRSLSLSCFKTCSISRRWPDKEYCVRIPPGTKYWTDGTEAWNPSFPSPGSTTGRIHRVLLMGREEGGYEGSAPSHGSENIWFSGGFKKLKSKFFILFHTNYLVSPIKRKKTLKKKHKKHCEPNKRNITRKRKIRRIG